MRAARVYLPFGSPEAIVAKYLTSFPLHAWDLIQYAIHEYEMQIPSAVSSKESKRVSERGTRS